MAHGRKGKLNYRCPRCLMREIDMDSLYDRDKNEYYCLRCSFTGNEKEVLRPNAQFRDKYRNWAKRITEFLSQVSLKSSVDLPDAGHQPVLHDLSIIRVARKLAL